MQYYLWWTTQDSRPAKTINLSAGDILVRAVRHHNDHGLLDAEELEDYLHFQQAEINDDDLVGQPWPEEQLQFVDAADPVRLVLGRPGSGKTTVLWKAVEARSGQWVLYLTWSRELTRYAMEHFQAFAPLDVHIEARDFSTFIGEICGTDIKRLTLQESQATSLQATKRLQRPVLGLWAGREYALFAELRAFLIGRAIPNEDGVDIVQGLVRLSDEAYLRQRGDHEGVGPEAANSLLKIFELLQSKISFTGIFPELIAAADAIARLRRDEIPEGFADFDRIMIDEVQDLTLLEAAVIVEFCRAVARDNRYAPGLLIAGDDGQTVRPSGFDCGTLNDLIARRVETPRKFQLEDNLRCPTKIAEVIERASCRCSFTLCKYPVS